MLLAGVEHNLITFVGDLTVSNIVQAHEELGAALRQDGPVVVDIDGVAEIDLTFVQLLESARRKAAETGRDLTLRHPADGAVLEVLRRGGFLDNENSQRAQFWLQGAAQ
ncbi:STAS domain-containing protein [Caulobacter soli]|uniref:STAS domain-containing protein n=1 Tax=Caulobacter soli TaxID=2708539 RepID=UPI0013EBEC97|nr:STAS domain-containing protein [Caulobacter soli]